MDEKVADEVGVDGKRIGRRRFNRPKARQTHGKRYTPEYVVWTGMKVRCRDPKSEAFPNYGGRGIKVCERWESFAAFYEDMGPRPGPGYKLDRKNNDGDYEPGNCRWVTNRENCRNTRANRVVEHLGVKKTLMEWCLELGRNYSTVQRRLNAGLTTEEAFDVRPRKKGKPSRKPNLVAFGEEKTVADWARDPRCAVTYQGLDARLRRGWELEKALTCAKKKNQYVG